MKALRLKSLASAAAICLMLTVGLTKADALEIDITPIQKAIDEAVAAGVDQESAMLNAVRDASDGIFETEKSADPTFNMSKKEIAAEIFAQLGTEAMASPQDADMEGLVIDILPIESDVVAMMDTGVAEDVAIKTVANEWAVKVYEDEKSRNPEFDMPIEIIAQYIEEMLWEMGVDDIEGYETPEAFENTIREATALSPIDDEPPASQI